MSEAEKNLTPGEREILNKLNTRARLILELEEVYRQQKMPFNKDYMYTLDEEDLRAFIFNLSPDGQAKLRESIKIETKSKKQHIKSVFTPEERQGPLAQLVRATDS